MILLGKWSLGWPSSSALWQSQACRTRLPTATCTLATSPQEQNRLVIYDWTDAAISFPTLDGVMLASCVPDDHREKTVAGYVNRWREGFPSVDFEAIREPSIIANEIYQAISYERIYRTQEPRTRWEMGGVVAGVLRGLGQRWLELAAR